MNTTPHSTPYCLFSIAQSQILQGKTASAFAKDISTQLSKIYVTGPSDVLAELDEQDPRGAEESGGCECLPANYTLRDSD